ncbi:MAG: TspO/MBR family protein [Methanobacteriota archaeon]
MDQYVWYQSIEKPFFAPPTWAFGVAWGILYPIIFLSFGFVFIQAAKKRIPYKVALPFALNLIANLAFTPIQFGLKNFWLAAVDITIVVVTLVWAMKAVYPHFRKIAYLQTPYLLWGLYATALQYSVTILN